MGNEVQAPVRVENEALGFTLELTRTDAANNPYRLPAARQQYTLRTAGGGSELIEIPWDALLDVLTALQQPDHDPEFEARMGELLRSVLAPAGWTAMGQEIAKAAAQDRRVVVTLRFNAAELYALPWELMTLARGGGHLGARESVLIRYAWPETTTIPPVVEPQPEGGRVLLAWSAAGGQVPAREHLAAIATGCRLGHVEFDNERDVVAHASCDSIVDALAAAKAAGSPVTVLHLLCHGGSTGSTFGLVLDGEDKGAAVDAGRLRRVLEPFAGTLRLVVLAACDGGNAGAAGNHLGSVAQGMHCAGLAAVIASRFALSWHGSIVLAEKFYRTLLEGPESLETAFLAARACLAVKSRHDWANLQLHARDADGDDTRPIVFRPYRGLLAFEARHRRFFFGRDNERAATVSALTALQTRGRPRFLVVAGASGTGKSSMVLAGAIPDLQDTLGRSNPPKHLQTRIIRPGADPMAALRSTLAPGDPRPLLLVVDQFEEVFTQTEEPAIRREFARALWSLGLANDSQVSVVLTIRVDFLGRCGEVALDDAGLRLDQVAYDEAHRVLVAQMGRSQLRSAIEDPARRVGLRLDLGLADRILADVEGEPGALPPISYTLDLLWQQRSGRMLTQATYDALGGVTGALYGRADALVNAMDEACRLQARRLLVRLVGIGSDGTPDTRRRVVIEKVRPADPGQAAVFDAVLSDLVDARLLVQGAADGISTIEMAHEALVRRWPRLREWIQADAERLCAVAEVEGWVAVRRRFGTFLQDDQLRYAIHVRDRFRGELGEGALELIAASEASAKRTRDAEEKARVAAERVLSSSLMEGARELLTRGHIHPSLLLMAVKDPENTRGWVSLAGEVLARRFSATTLQHEGLVSIALWSPDSKRILTISHAEARVWRSDGSGEPFLLSEQFGPARQAAWSPDGERIVAVDNEMARVWRVDGSGVPIALVGHSQWVVSAMWSPDSLRVVTASGDNTARVWRADGSGDPFIFRGHDGPVYVATWSPDGTRILTASADATAQVWNADGSGTAAILAGHTGRVLTAAWNPDGRRILTTGDNHIALVWNADGSGAPILLEAEVRTAEWSPDGKHIVTVLRDNTTRVWRADGSREPLILKGDLERINSAAWSPDGQYLLVTSEDRAVTRLRLWRADGSRDSIPIDGQPDELVSAEWSPDGRHILATALDHKVRIWNIDVAGDPVLEGHSDGVMYAQWSRDGLHVLTASMDGEVAVWRADGSIRANPFSYGLELTNSAMSPDGLRVLLTYHQEQTAWVHNIDRPNKPIVLEGHSRAVTSAAWSPDGLRILTASRDRTARVWRADGLGESLLLDGHAEAVTFAAWSPDGLRILTACEDGTTRVWPPDGRGPPILLVGPNGVTSAAWSPDGRRILTASPDGSARVWNPDGEAPSLPLVGHSDELRFLRWSPDSRRILTTSRQRDRTARVWQADGASAPVLLAGHSNDITSAAWSPDGQRILTASHDRTARVWNADGSGVPIVLKGHTDQINGAAWSPDGRHIVTASSDKTVRVWNSDGSGIPVLLAGHRDIVQSVAWSPNGLRILSASSDRTARIWTVDIDDLQRRLRATTTDCLLPSERERYLGEDEHEACENYEACERAHGRTYFAGLSAGRGTG